MSSSVFYDQTDGVDGDDKLEDQLRVVGYQKFQTP